MSDKQPLLGDDSDAPVSMEDMSRRSSAAAPTAAFDEFDARRRLEAFFRQHDPDSLDMLDSYVDECRAHAGGVAGVLAELRERYDVPQSREGSRVPSRTGSTMRPEASVNDTRSARGSVADAEPSQQRRGSARVSTRSSRAGSTRPPQPGVPPPLNDDELHDFFASSSEDEPEVPTNERKPKEKPANVFDESEEEAENTSRMETDAASARLKRRMLVDSDSDTGVGGKAKEYEFSDHSDEDKPGRNFAPGPSDEAGKPIHYPAPGRDDGYERSVMVSHERVGRAHKKLQKQTTKPIRIRAGFYNDPLAEKMMEDHQEKVEETFIFTIKGLHERVTHLAAVRKLYGLDPADDTIIEEQTRNYVFDALRVQSIVANPRMRNVCEFDEEDFLERMARLPPTHAEIVWSNMLHSRLVSETERLRDLQRFMDEDAWHAECEYIPSRDDEFIAELHKMQSETLAEQRAKRRHFVFSTLPDRLTIARLSYNHHPAVFNHVASGTAELEELVGPQLVAKRRSKYTALATYFRSGFAMHEFAADIYFDGAQFYDARPFVAAPGGKSAGYIVSVNLAMAVLRQTPLYKRRSSYDADDAAVAEYIEYMRELNAEKLDKTRKCCPNIDWNKVATFFMESLCYCRSGRQRQIDEILGTPSIRNLGRFFDAILEGEQAVEELRELILDGNVIAPCDLRPLCALISRAKGLTVLSLNGVRFNENVMVATDMLKRAIENCTNLVTVNFSDIRAFDPDSRMYEPAPDEAIAQLLMALRPTKRTLRELWCAGALPPAMIKAFNHPELMSKFTEGDFFHDYERGRAGPVSGPIIKAIVDTYPQLVSVNFSFQSLASEVVASISRKLLDVKNLLNAYLVGIRVPVPTPPYPIVLPGYKVFCGCCWCCCCCPCARNTGPLIDMYDEPSFALVDEVLKHTDDNRRLKTEKTRVAVVRDMFDRYRTVYEHRKDDKIAEVRTERRRLDERRRRHEALVHRKALELGEVRAAPHALLEIGAAGYEKFKTPEMTQTVTQAAVPISQRLQFAVLAHAKSALTQRITDLAETQVLGLASEAPAWYNLPLQYIPDPHWSRTDAMPIGKPVPRWVPRFVHLRRDREAHQGVPTSPTYGSTDYYRMD